MTIDNEDGDLTRIDQRAKWKVIWDVGKNAEAEPKTLLRANIKQLPEVFQQRDLDDEHLARESHISKMAKALKTGQPLDPITVFAIGEEFICIDGHHRLAAYGEAEWTKKIPVKVFNGTFSDAWAHSLTANNKDKLPMSTSDKLEATWIMVLTGDYSQSVTASKSGAGIAAVKRMAAAIKLVREKDVEPTKMTWEGVKEFLKGGQVEMNDDQLAAMVAAMSRRIAKEFGPDLSKRAGLFAEALVQCSGQAARQVWEELDGHYGDQDGDLEDTDF